MFKFVVVEVVDDGYVLGFGIGLDSVVNVVKGIVGFDGFDV